LDKDGFNGLTLSGQQQKFIHRQFATDRSRPSPGQTDSVFFEPEGQFQQWNQTNLQ
jgi:hypothetical protein